MQFYSYDKEGRLFPNKRAVRTKVCVHVRFHVMFGNQILLSVQYLLQLETETANQADDHKRSKYTYPEVRVWGNRKNVIH